MSVTVHTGDTVLFTGDSITARGWFNPSVGGLVYLVNNGVKHVTASVGGGSVQATNTGPGQALNMGITAVNTGINGNTTADIAANVAGRITNFNPNVVIIAIGVNDVANRVDIATSTANYNTILTAVRAALPTAQIGLLPILCFGENWSAGPPVAWANGATDANVDAFNAMVVTMCSTYTCTYIDTHAALLQWETINNAPAPGAAEKFTGEGVHPLITASEIIMGQWAFPYTTVVP